MSEVSFCVVREHVRALAAADVRVQVDRLMSALSIARQDASEVARRGGSRESQLAPSLDLRAESSASASFALARIVMQQFLDSAERQAGIARADARWAQVAQVAAPVVAEDINGALDRAAAHLAALRSVRRTGRTPGGAVEAAGGSPELFFQAEYLALDAMRSIATASECGRQYRAVTDQDKALDRRQPTDAPATTDTATIDTESSAPARSTSDDSFARGDRSAYVRATN